MCFVLRRRRCVVTGRVLGECGLEPTGISGPPENLQHMRIGLDDRNRRQEVVDLARAPTAPIAAKAGTKKEEILHVAAMPKALSAMRPFASFEAGMRASQQTLRRIETRGRS